MSVLVSYVPTKVGFVALEEGIKAAGALGVPLVLANVAVGQNFAEVTFADEQHLDAVRDRLSEAGVQYDIRQLVDVDDVAESVLRLADEVAAELIVVGIRRRSPVGKLLLGSNAQQIILSANCPVLSVRAPLE